MVGMGFSYSHLSLYHVPGAKEEFYTIALLYCHIVKEVSPVIGTTKTFMSIILHSKHLRIQVSGMLVARNESWLGLATWPGLRDVFLFRFKMHTCVPVPTYYASKYPQYHIARNECRAKPQLHMYITRNSADTALKWPSQGV